MFRVALIMLNPLALVLSLGLLVRGATLQASIVGLDDFDYETTSLVLRDLKSYSRQRVPLRADGSVEIYNLVPNHKYLLSVDSDTLELPWSYVVKTPSEPAASQMVEQSDVDGGWDVRKVVDGQPLSSVGPRVDYPLEIRGTRRAELVVDRPEFGVFKFFLQPSVLLSIGALVLVTYLPSWLQNLDPEVMAELQKNQIGAKKE